MSEEKECLEAVSPVDGRYREYLKELSQYFSESALFKYRTRIIIEYFIELSDKKLIRKLSEAEVKGLRSIYKEFNTDSALRIKEIEKTTSHDIKAVECFILEKLPESLKDLKEMVYFGLTSADVDESSYGLMIKEFLDDVYYENTKSLLKKLLEMAEEYKGLPMLSRTHGQPASPTTLGKEIAVFMERLRNEMVSLKNLKIHGKLNGAVGNYNAHSAAFPEFDWISFSEAFLKRLGLEPSTITTQIEPHDSLAAILHSITRINNITINLDRDFWHYISNDCLIQKTIKQEVGSSVMPHKVNPIDFENSEGNLGVANALFNHFADKLTISRLQRDLSDKTAMRNIGVGFAHSILAYKNTLKGLNKVSANKERLRQELDQHPEVLSEAIQTVLRKEGVRDSYEKLKELTRGENMDIKKIQDFVNNLDVSYRTRKQLLELKPENYIGKALELTEIAIRRCEKFLES